MGFCRLITSASADLRDAKITITPDGKLMLSGAAALHQPSKQSPSVAHMVLRERP